MKAKKNKRQRSEQMQQVSAALGDLLGMKEWRKEHPKATWAEIEAAVDEQMNQVRAQLLEDLVQMGRARTGARSHQESVRSVRPAGSRSRHVESRPAPSKRAAGKRSN
jgi:hypothetical protein